MKSPDTVSQYIAAMQRSLSADRLDAYRPPDGDDLAMIVTYFWNVALCQALYPSLGALEVAMRNGIHDALRARFSRDDWYDAEGVLLPAEVKRVERAKKKIRDAKRDEIADDHDPATPGRVVASLTFGDWTSLLAAGYGGSPKGPQFWASTTGLLAAVFPHAPNDLQRERANLHRYINRFRLLRNRVFHYEPIWNGVRLPALKRKQPHETVAIEELHAQLLDVIAWVRPPVAATVGHLDTFRSVQHVTGRDRIETDIKAHLGV